MPTSIHHKSFNLWSSQPCPGETLGIIQVNLFNTDVYGRVIGLKLLGLPASIEDGDSFSLRLLRVSSSWAGVVFGGNVKSPIVINEDGNHLIFLGGSIQIEPILLGLVVIQSSLIYGASHNS